MDLNFKRPKNLATAKVSSAKSAIHAVNYYTKRYGKIDYVVLFQPTSPFRTKRSLKLSNYQKNSQKNKSSV